MKSPIFKSPLRAHKLFLMGLVIFIVGLYWGTKSQGTLVLVFDVIGLLLIIDALIVHSRRKHTKSS